MAKNRVEWLESNLEQLHYEEARELALLKIEENKSLKKTLRLIRKGVADHNMGLNEIEQLVDKEFSGGEGRG